MNTAKLVTILLVGILNIGVTLVLGGLYVANISPSLLTAPQAKHAVLTARLEKAKPHIKALESGQAVK